MTIARIRTTAVAVGAAAGLIGTAVLVATPAAAGVTPMVTGLSMHRDAYWGGSVLVVRGLNFTGATAVVFGRKHVRTLQVTSPTRITVVDPSHAYGSVDVRVVSANGTSRASSADRFAFVAPTMNNRIQGGLTGRQEQRIARRVLRAHHGVHIARRSSRWTAAMGVSAMRRARSWLGMPYSWAGGNGSGPTRGVCAHNGGDLDCHVIGFDCSGLALYSWWPYERLAHYAATQHARAGRFHPSVGELEPGDLVFFSGYIAGGIGHVAVYAGGGWVIQAAESGTVVMRSRLTDVILANGTYRGATRPMSTGRQGAGPRLTSVTAQVSSRGGTIVVTGSGLAGATSVSVGGNRVYRFVSDHAGRLVVRVPAHAAGAVSVAVSNAWGTASGRSVYVAPPATTALSPATGSTAGGTAVTVAGTALATVKAVDVGSTAVPFTRVPGGLTITMPAHAAGTVAVVAVSPFGDSAPLTYTYVDAAPSSSPSTPTATASTAHGTTAHSTTASTASSATPTTAAASVSSAASTPAPTTPAPTTPVPTTPVPTGTSSAPGS